jgi:hypothetical protein
LGGSGCLSETTQLAPAFFCALPELEHHMLDMVSLKERCVVKVKLSELLVALNRSTRMKRAPTGVFSSGLNQAAFVPELTGFRVEMPGASSLVNTLEGRLPYEIIITDLSKIALLKKVLKKYQGYSEAEVSLNLLPGKLDIVCGSTKMSFPVERQN